MNHVRRRAHRAFRPIAWTLALLGTILAGGLLSAAEAYPAQPAAVTAPASAQVFPPLGFEHFKYPNICVDDRTIGWYPAQITTIVNGLNSGTQRLNVWDAKGGGACSPFETGQRLQVVLVAAADANNYSWCAKTYGAVNSAGEWVNDPDVSYPTRIYYNYYKSVCGADGQTGRRNTLSGVIAEALGLERYYGGTDYTVENIDRVNIPWPTTYDYLRLNSVY